MSDTFNDVLVLLDGAMAEPNEEVNFSFMNNNSGITGQEIPTDPTMLKARQFGSPGAQFGYPNAIWNSALSGENLQGASSLTDQNSFADGDQLLSSWSGDTIPSDHCGSTSHPGNTTIGAGVLRVGNSQNSFSDINQDALLFGADETKDIGKATEDDSTSEMVPNTDLSQADPNPFDPHMACRESTQSGNMRSFFVQAHADWTYREMLEIVALPPPEGLHFWHDRVLPLATDLGMPNGATGKDIVIFVLHVASVKNELNRVVPLVKALAVAARVLEGRIVAPTTLLPAVLALYPSARPLCGIATEMNATSERYHDEITSEEEET